LFFINFILKTVIFIQKNTVNQLLANLTTVNTNKNQQKPSKFSYKCKKNKSDLHIYPYIKRLIYLTS